MEEKLVFGLQNKVAVVTGGSSGIGLATALRLSEFGAKTAIVDVNEAAGQEAVKKIQDSGGIAIFFQCDVIDAKACENTVRRIVDHYEKIDILVNNAGIIKRKTVVDLEEAEWDAVLDVCLKGVFLLSKYIIPVMTKNGGGSIVNTSSGWGLKGGDVAAAYCAAKAGVVNLSKAMAIDHGKHNVRVNCVAPGDTDTPLLRDEARQLQQNEDQFVVSSGHGRPLARVGSPQDIANSILFLVSDLAAWITGSVLVVDGGGLA